MSTMAQGANAMQNRQLKVERHATAIVGLANAIILIGTNDQVPVGVASAVEELGYAVEENALKLLEELERPRPRDSSVENKRDRRGAEIIELA